MTRRLEIDPLHREPVTSPLLLRGYAFALMATAVLGTIVWVMWLIVAATVAGW